MLHTNNGQIVYAGAGLETITQRMALRLPVQFKPEGFWLD